MILILDTTLTPALKTEGFAREIVRRIQSMRKELNLAVEDKIKTQIHTTLEQQQALHRWKKYIQGETRSSTVSFVDKPTGILVKTWKIDDFRIEIGIAK